VIALAELGHDESSYRALAEGDPILTGSEVETAVRRSLGAEPKDLFAWFDPVGVSASIGQVHQARLHDGRMVAVKIRYPDIEETLGLDLRSLGWLTLPFGGLSRFDAEAYRAEVGAMLRLELDYREEAASLTKFRALSRGVRGLEVPEVIQSLSTSNVLVMTWIEGGGFDTTRGWSLGERVAAARTLVDTFVRGLTEWRIVHADPHPGNLRFRLTADGPKVGLIDFGCVKEISPVASASLSDLLRVGLEGRWDRPPEEFLARFAALGFGADLLAPMAHRLGAVARLLVEPFVSREPVDLRQAAFGPGMAEVLGDHRFSFRAAGPASLLFVIRAWHGLLTYLRELDAPVAWREFVESSVGDRPPAPALLATATARPPECRSRFLKIRVTENGACKVELTFPAHRAADVADLMPEDLGPKLAGAGIEVAGLARKALATRFEPGDLFRFHEGSKEIAVWLE